MKFKRSFSELLFACHYHESVSGFFISHCNRLNNITTMIANNNNAIEFSIKKLLCFKANLVQASDF